ncbi:helix-turn-helix transcriptional regulator [Salisediminibacterium selenitireducens]|uniref:Transcriptional regulator, AraC family n=1 Tax=Bacillus selenitireducens (strain ATCC 700615 / DSM 15326 / MLS10) TaxID=439292 RepID=D6Y0K8_BACIE|nr:AraC family transcriptional regulator [Salisediminibacterium selenitireducens]ADI00576.1 transcriptional regulator, AraC family [[Bacillus] selenitireducens MLS10]
MQQEMLHLFYYTTGIPIHYLALDGRPLASMPHTVSDPLNRIETVSRLASERVPAFPDGEARAIVDDLHQHYYGRSVMKNGVRTGILLVGPTQVHDITKDRWDALFYQGGFSLNEKDLIHRQYENTPKMPFIQMKYVKMLLEQLERLDYSHLTGLSEEDEDYFNVRRTIKGAFTEEPVDHAPLALEQEFLDALVAGDRSVLERISDFDKFPVPPIGNGSPVRAYKNVLISGVAVAIRRIAEVGIDFRELQHYSDRFILKVEQTEDMGSLLRLFQQMFLDLFDMVEEYRQESYSQSVLIGIRYIRNHLDSSFRLDNVAKEVGLNPRYFGTLFKEETGKTILQFVTEERISLAKRLLRDRQNDIADVAKYVGFSSQSHFTQVFRKKVGKTPKVYQETHSSHVVEENGA